MRHWIFARAPLTTSELSDAPPFAFPASQGGRLPGPPWRSPGHPTTRPFGFAALLGLTGSHKTRLFEPQTSYDSFSRQPCATRPRKRGLGPCILLFVRNPKASDTSLRTQNTASGLRLAAPKNCSTMRLITR